MSGRTPTGSRSRLVGPAVLAAAALLLAACGTRVDDAAIVAGAGGGPAQIDRSVLEQLRSAGGATGAGATGAGAAGAPIGAGSSEATAPGAAQSGTGGAAAGAGGVGAVAGGSAPGNSGAGASVPGGARQGGSAQDNKAGGTAKAESRAGVRAQEGRAATGAGAAGAACTESGAPVALGQVGSFSGVAGPITASARTAMAAWAKDVNARGGLACHPVVLYPADDGADPARSAAAVQDLVQSKNVQAIVGAFTALSQSGLNSGVAKAGIPVVGGDVIDFSWNQHPNLFPQGAGISGLIRGALQQTIGSGKTKLGLLYCVEASVCTTGAKVIESETAKLGGELVYSSAVSLTQTDFTAQCQNAKSKGVQALGVAVDGAAMGRVARSCAALGYHPQFLGSALVMSPKQAEDPNIRKNTMSTGNANAPFVRTDTPGQREYQAAMKRYAPGLIPDGASTQAWASGKLLEAAIAGLGPEARGKPITTAVIFKGLGTIKDETLDGLAPPITFTEGQKAAPVINCTYFMLLTTKGWTAENSKPVCEDGQGRKRDDVGSSVTEPAALVRPAAHHTTGRRRTTTPKG